MPPHDTVNSEFVVCVKLVILVWWLGIWYLHQYSGHNFYQQYILAYLYTIFIYLMHLYTGFYRVKPLDLFIYAFVWMYIGILVIFNLEVTVSDNGENLQ